MTNNNKIAEMSGAISLKREKNQRYGETVGTLKLFTAEYDKDIEPEKLDKLPNYNGFIIVDKKLAEQSTVQGKDGKSKILLNVAVWKQ